METNNKSSSTKSNNKASNSNTTTESVNHSSNASDGQINGSNGNGVIHHHRTRLNDENDSDDEAILNLFSNDNKNGEQTNDNAATETFNEDSTLSNDVIPEEIKKEEEELNQEMEQEQQKDKDDFDVSKFQEEMKQHATAKLKLLIDRTTMYSEFLSQKISKPTELEVSMNDNADANGNEPAEQEEEPEAAENPQGKRKRGNTKGSANKKGKKANQMANLSSYQNVHANMARNSKQPALITGGEMRPYQIRGVEWLVSLYENGLNGILADEMGLGKTVQCIGLIAHLIQNGILGPYLIVAPLTTLSNWIREFQRWAPSLSVMMYHGNKAERAVLRNDFRKFGKPNGFNAIITSYQIVMIDKKYFRGIQWKYIIVDEGHRIKNLNCKLVRELKSYDSANRLLLTGTPLQNNLTELWSMLNFLLPDIFNDLDSFQRWFDFSALNDKANQKRIIEQEEEKQIVSKLHVILRPFLLRRVKTDVELQLPKKYVKIVPTKLATIQSTYYKAILSKDLGNILTPEAQKRLKNQGSSLQNMLVQLRKVCNHPYLFDWPQDKDGEDIVDERLVKASGKLQILDRLLPRLKSEGHKVLIFSQMTKMMDILEDYLTLRKLSYCRLDGQTPQKEREEKIQEFNNKDNYFCFLLSTRAGGLGINLTAADVAIFYDSDWNPQMDLQAQDRCHRIGQTREVYVFRFATSNSIESRILERQEFKMKLERLVIQKGNFKGIKSKSSINQISELEELLSSETPNLVGTEEITDDELFAWTEKDLKYQYLPQQEETNGQEAN
mmetsp:Transcript_4425/g.6197  ORF Transcript_4425/g.6197 Transcript_4425/m.6197 type:complete len:783 (-) Transcript_4425:63-2411(-)